MQNQLLSIAYQAVDPKKAERLATCATEVSFSLNDSSGQMHLASANFCRVRLCPMCQWRRSLKVYFHTKSILDGIRSDRPMSYIFLTLTVRNVSGDELGATIDSMMAGWNRLLERKPVTRAVKGSYRGMEITHNLNRESPDFDTYHPHFHVVFAVNPSYFTDRAYLSQAAWMALWRSCARLDYDPIVDVRRVRGDTAEAVAEAAKYSMKPSDYIIPDDWDLTVDTVRLLDKVLNNRRFVSYSGLMAEWHKRLNLDNEDDGDLIHTDATETVPDDSAPKIWYAWRSGYSQYFRVD